MTADEVYTSFVAVLNILKQAQKKWTPEEIQAKLDKEWERIGPYFGMEQKFSLDKTISRIEAILYIIDKNRSGYERDDPVGMMFRVRVTELVKIMQKYAEAMSKDVYS